MALTNYLTQVGALLQTPPAPTTLYPTATLTTYINIARNQLAGESKCIEVMTNFNTTSGTQAYSFSNLSVSSAAGINSIISVEQLWIKNVGLSQWITPRSWEYFSLFSSLNNPTSQLGPPTNWAQYAKGINGALYLDPTPDFVYTIQADCVGLPINLSTDNDPEAIPYPYTDCIPFLAVYWIFLSAQSAARQDDANRMYQRYQEFLMRAGGMSTPSILPYQYDANLVADQAANKRLAFDASAQQGKM